MILLDTDHISVLQVPDSQRRVKLIERLDKAVGEVIGVSIISIEEQMRGWLATIAKERQVSRQVNPYDALQRLFTFHIASFDATAAATFDEMRRSKIRIATMDLKIASVALVQKALLLTANLRDFEQVPGLRVENWLEN